MVTAALALSGAGAASAAAGVPRQHPELRPGLRPDRVIIHHIREPRARIRAFWHRRRLRRVHPLGTPLPARAVGSAPPRTARRAIWVRGVAPRVTRLTDERSRIWTSHNQLPATTVGKLFFRSSVGTGFCTATVIRAPNGNTVWTAGHCVSDGSGGWYSNFLFQPDRHDGIAPFGSFVPRYVATTAAFFYYSDYRYDVAAFAMATDGERLQDLVGAQGIKLGGSSYHWRNVYDFGYPADLIPSAASIDSEKLRYCTVNTSRDGELGMMRFRCNMGHGSSGGPLLWRLRRSRGWGYLIGTMSLGEHGSYRRWSPQLGTAAANVYNAVKNK